MKKYDLVVVGGGFSGVAASIAAAREGLDVLLVERSNCLGGAATNCLVNPFMKYWTIMDKSGERFHLNRGCFEIILKELAELGALAHGQTIFHEEYLKLILNRMVTKENVSILFHSYLTGVEISKETGRLNSIRVANKSGIQEFTADYYVDATGDADLAVLCGCSYRLGRESDHLCQPMTLCFRLANVDIERYKKSKPMIDDLYKKLQAEGKIKNVREDVLIFDNMIEGVLHFNSTRIVRKNPTDAFDITCAEIDAREQVFELFNFLVENIDGFQNSSLIMTASQIGVRESRMIDGVYTLTADDLKSCKRFDDAIAVGNYDIDIHNPEGSGTSHYFFPDGQYYTIPYRSLLPKEITNLVVAGRCISATHEAQASIRIIPIVCCIGEAAGAAVSVAHNSSTPLIDVDTEAVRELLKKHGAFII